MSYCTHEDLVRRFSADEIEQLTAERDPAAVDEAIADAAGEIDGYVSAAGYPVPMSPVPAIVRAYAADIARYRLYADAATEAVRTRYEDAIKFFRAVSRREVMLGATPPAPTGGEAVMQGGRQVFHGGGF